MDTDEILYADNTICVSEDEKTLSRLLAAIEGEGNKYGLKQNQKHQNSTTSVRQAKSSSQMEHQFRKLVK